MPKSNLCRDKKKELRITGMREMIDGGLARTGLTIAELAKKTGIQERTLRNRKVDPENMRFWEFWNLVDVLKPDEYYIRRLLGGE